MRPPNCKASNCVDKRSTGSFGVLFCLKQSGFRTPILGQAPIGLFVLDIIVIMEISFNRNAGHGTGI